MNMPISALSKLGETAAGGVAILKDHAAPALRELEKTIGNFNQDRLAPLIVGAMAALPEVGQEVGTTLENTGKAAYHFCKHEIGPDAGEKIQKAVRDHPIQAGLLAVSGLTILFPGLVSVPVLGALGWTPLGPSAG